MKKLISSLVVCGLTLSSIPSFANTAACTQDKAVIETLRQQIATGEKQMSQLRANRTSNALTSVPSTLIFTVATLMAIGEHKEVGFMTAVAVGSAATTGYNLYASTSQINQIDQMVEDAKANLDEREKQVEEGNCFPETEGSADQALIELQKARVNLAAASQTLANEIGSSALNGSTYVSVGSIIALATGAAIIKVANMKNIKSFETGGHGLQGFDKILNFGRGSLVTGTVLNVASSLAFVSKAISKSSSRAASSPCLNCSLKAFTRASSSGVS